MTFKKRRKIDPLNPLVTLVLGVAISVFGGWNAFERIHGRHQQNVVNAASHFYNETASQFSRIEREITVLAAFISKSGVPSPTQFHEVYNLTHDIVSESSIRAIGFAPLVETSKLPLIEERVRAQNDEYRDAGYGPLNVISSREADLVAPIILLEPPHRRKGSFGFDILTLGASRDSIDKMFENSAILTQGPTQIQQDRELDNDRLSILLYAPVSFDPALSEEWSRGIVATPVTPEFILQMVAEKHSLHGCRMEMVLEGAENSPISMTVAPQKDAEKQYWKTTHSAKPISLNLGNENIRLSLSHEIGVTALEIGVTAGVFGLLFSLSALAAAYFHRLRHEQHIIASKLARHEDQLRESERAIAQSQKQEAMGKLVGGVAHDFNNILAVILSNAEVIKTYPVSSDVEKIADEIIQSSMKGATLTRQLLSFGRRAYLSPKAEDVTEILTEAQSLFARVLPSSIAVELSLEKNLSQIHVDRNQLENALLNLAVNSRDAMPNGGTIHIKASNKTVPAGKPSSLGSTPPPGRYVVIELTDSGEGMSPETLSKASDPFFTTKDVADGAGLGLSMVNGFARQSGGTTQIDSALGKGTTVCVYVPVEQEAREGNLT